MEQPQAPVTVLAQLPRNTTENLLLKGRKYFQHLTAFFIIKASDNFPAHYINKCTVL